MLTGIIAQDNTVVLSDDGYPIIESEKPSVPEYCKAISRYTETDGKIIQSWEVTSQLSKAEAIDKFIASQVSKLDDNTALQYSVLYPEWSSDSVEYKVNDRVTYESVLYKCLISHTSRPDYNPIDSPNIWTKIEKE